MKKTTAIYIALALCVVIFALYFIISRVPDKDEAENEKDVYLYVDQNEVGGITEFSFTGGDVSLNFKKADGVWKYSKNTTLPVNGNVIEKMLGSVETVLAKKLISETADDGELTQYGLESPSYVLKILTPHGEKCYLFGDLIKSRGLRYMMKKGSTSVYLANDDIVESFSTELSDCLSTDKSPVIDKDRVVSIKTECGGFLQTDTAESAEKLLGALSTLTLERAVDFGADKFDIFGLSADERILVSVNYSDGKIVKIRFGLGETEEFIYALVENEYGVFSEMIYLISSVDMDSLSSHLSTAFDRRGGENQ